MSINYLKNDPSFTLLLVLPHQDIVPFVAEQFKSKSKIINVYLGLIFFLAAMIIVVASLDIRSGKITFWPMVSYFGIGTVLVVTVLILVHEGLHGLAYKLVGAPKISYGANWQQFYFYVVADRFVTNRKSFVFIAVLPFVVISALTLVVLPFASVVSKWVCLGILFIHTTACAGDFAMLGFYEQHRHAKELLTFDDVSEKRSYFYVRE